MFMPAPAVGPHDCPRLLLRSFLKSVVQHLEEKIMKKIAKCARLPNEESWSTFGWKTHTKVPMPISLAKPSLPPAAALIMWETVQTEGF